MAATTAAFEAELIAGGFSGRDRGLMAAQAYRLRMLYLAGMVDPAAHTNAKMNVRQSATMTAKGKTASFDAITGP